MREEGEDDSSWEARVAKNYESKLFKEFALVSSPSYIPTLFFPPCVHRPPGFWKCNLIPPLTHYL